MLHVHDVLLGSCHANCLVINLLLISPAANAGFALLTSFINLSTILEFTESLNEDLVCVHEGERDRLGECTLVQVPGIHGKGDAKWDAPL